jgi:isoleucyl-tRNA synthetase
MGRFHQVPVQADFPAMERATLERWAREKTFERSVEQAEGRPEYVFYDGPPFATGLPHYGHILTSYIKDLVPRYFTMQGRYVPRRWGWDCHGLPVEYEVEKDLGFRSRGDILAFGIDKFNEACRKTVLRYAGEWRRIITRLGRWVDFDHDYKTMDPDYMESVVWAFKALHDRGLVYEGDKVVAYCTRCQTPLSNFEARQDDAFRSRQDPAITVRFRWKGDPQHSFLGWTTTPWTLVSNVALAVAADAQYVAMEGKGETVWLAEAALPRYERELQGYQPVRRAPGRDLVGTAYQPIFPYFGDTPNAFRVIAAGFVTTEDGTGIVHLAPAFGEEDNVACAAIDLQGPNPVQDDGTFDPRVSDFAGQHVFAANDAIIRHLKGAGVLLKRESFEHNYPHCWRCDSPLIYRAIRTWFVAVTRVKDQMIAANRSISWVPEHIRDGRFGNWLENARDWAVSRNRFWGAPVPVWRCDRCAAVQVVGSRAELEALWGQPVTDWHRPSIDTPRWPCQAGDGGTMSRVPDVLDCWFESGSMPYAQVHYPVENKERFEATFPGDFIVEYVAQTRGWFYTMVVLAAALFRRPPFRNAVCHGVLLADDGRKMSKRLKNYPDPLELVEAHGSDSLRVALLQSAVARGNDVRFSGASARDAVRRLLIPTWNSLHLLTAYANIDGFEPKGTFPAPSRLDRYLLHETERLRQTLETHMGSYDFASCYEAIEEYVVMLSTWYIRLTKHRLWQPGETADKTTAFEALYGALSTLARLVAPFLPFLAESMHEALGGERSVHLEAWPAARPEWRDDQVGAEMQALRTVVRLTRSIREEHRLKHRHPLPWMTIAGVPAQVIESNLQILTDELNVKSVKALASAAGHARRVVKLDFKRLGSRLRDQVKELAAAVGQGKYTLGEDGVLRVGSRELQPEDYTVQFVPTVEGTGVAAEGDVVVVLELETTPELVVEGQVRDLNRGLQDLRKEAGLRYEERIRLSISGPPALMASMKSHFPWIAEQTLAVQIDEAPLGNALATRAIDVGDATVSVALDRAP